MYPVLSLTGDLAGIAAAAALTMLLCLAVRRRPALAARAAAGFRASAGRLRLCVIAAMVLPLALRLVVLPWAPPPVPHVHDEFSHLLVADTLAAGRLANPPHPLWRHLETIYVLQQPGYASIYPIGQGAVLAAGKMLTGHPWAGVLLSVALMCGAITWMLFGCLPPNWAAVGGLLAAVAYGLNPQWVDSYWGGAFCAFGGALLFGALCRLRKSPSRAMALVAGAGWSLVWLTRPFESLLLLIIMWGLIAAFLFRDPRAWKQWLGPVASILAVQMLAGGVTALHNRAVTGSYTTLPYHLSRQAYGVPQSLLWQAPVERPALRFTELKDMYSWQRAVKDQASARPAGQLAAVVQSAWAWFVTPWYSLPIVVLIYLSKDRQVLLGGGMMAGALVAGALYPFFFPHYIAAYSCVIVFLIIRGMMSLFESSSGGKVVVVFLLSGGLIAGLRSPHTRPAGFRAQVSDRLMRSGGRHVVFVRYGARHNFHDEWVYNAADVDASPIVWCRASNRTEEAEVTGYYKDRRFWLADVDGDGDGARLSAYEPGPQAR